jgi:hypothetical protein
LVGWLVVAVVAVCLLRRRFRPPFIHTQQPHLEMQMLSPAKQRPRLTSAPAAPASDEAVSFSSLRQALRGIEQQIDALERAAVRPIPAPACMVLFHPLSVSPCAVPELLDIEVHMAGKHITFSKVDACLLLSDVRDALPAVPKCA